MHYSQPGVRVPGCSAGGSGSKGRRSGSGRQSASCRHRNRIGMDFPRTLRVRDQISQDWAKSLASVVFPTPMTPSMAMYMATPFVHFVQGYHRIRFDAAH